MNWMVHKMIHNLCNYLRSNFSATNFVAEAWNETSPDDAILVRDTGGQQDHYNGRKDATVQFVSRSQDVLKAKLDLAEVYGKLVNRFGLMLPEVKVGGATFPEVKTYRIVPMQMPSYIGIDNSFHAYSFNVEVTLGYYDRRQVV